MSECRAGVPGERGGAAAAWRSLEERMTLKLLHSWKKGAAAFPPSPTAAATRTGYGELIDSVSPDSFIRRMMLRHLMNGVILFRYAQNHTHAFLGDAMVFSSYGWKLSLEIDATLDSMTFYH